MIRRACSSSSATLSAGKIGTVTMFRIARIADDDLAVEQQVIGVPVPVVWLCFGKQLNFIHGALYQPGRRRSLDDLQPG